MADYTAQLDSILDILQAYLPKMWDGVQLLAGLPLFFGVLSGLVIFLIFLSRR